MNNTQEALIQAVVSDYIKETGDQNPDEKKLKNYIEQKGGDKYLQQKLQSLTQKAAHGAKLQYVKALKHKCAEDEELIYYKKGGSVGCGCKKKFQEGGTPRKDSVVTKFRQDQNKKRKENNTWTPQDDKYLLNARRKNGKNLTPEEKTTIQKWNNLSQEQKSKHQLEEGKSGMKMKKVVVVRQ